MQTLSARSSSIPRNSIYNAFPPSRDFWKGSSSHQPSLDNSISLHEAVAFFPSLQRLSMRGDRLSPSSQQTHNQVSGFPALQKKLKGMLGKPRNEEKLKPLRSLPHIKPEEILSCRLVPIQELPRRTQRVCPTQTLSTPPQFHPFSSLQRRIDL